MKTLGVMAIGLALVCSSAEVDAKSRGGSSGSRSTATRTATVKSQPAVISPKASTTVAAPVTTKPRSSRFTPIVPLATTSPATPAVPARPVAPPKPIAPLPSKPITIPPAKAPPVYQKPAPAHTTTVVREEPGFFNNLGTFLMLDAIFGDDPAPQPADEPDCDVDDIEEGDPDCDELIKALKAQGWEQN